MRLSFWSSLWWANSCWNFAWFRSAGYDRPNEVVEVLLLATEPCWLSYECRWETPPHLLWLLPTCWCCCCCCWWFCWCCCSWFCWCSSAAALNLSFQLWLRKSVKSFSIVWTIARRQCVTAATYLYRILFECSPTKWGSNVLCFLCGWTTRSWWM